MTDDDYVAELRSYGGRVTNEAADRIEALTAERKEDYKRLLKIIGAIVDEYDRHMLVAEADNTRLLKIIGAIVDEYDGQMHGPILHTINAGRAAITGKADT